MWILICSYNLLLIINTDQSAIINDDHVCGNIKDSLSAPHNLITHNLPIVQAFLFAVIIVVVFNEWRFRSLFYITFLSHGILFCIIAIYLVRYLASYMYKWFVNYFYDTQRYICILSQIFNVDDNELLWYHINFKPSLCRTF